MRRLIYMLEVLIAPERFIRAAMNHSIELSKRTHQGPFTEEHRARHEEFAREQTKAIRRAILLGVGTTLVTIAVGYLAGLALRQVVVPTKGLVYVFQAIGAAIILGATLSQIGRKDESFGGENLADQMNAYIFRALYVLGTLIFVASVTWDAI